MRGLYLLAISIHAPPRGATFGGVTLCRVRIDFNSRPSARGDTAFSVVTYKNFIFQFTPLREGRRILHLLILIQGLYFNSRPSARGDITPPISTPKLKFQFTPLREGRLVGKCTNGTQNHFNSRPSARGDPIGCRLNFGVSHFNSRPSARGDSTDVASKSA